jgi:hypothetical protein
VGCGGEGRLLLLLLLLLALLLLLKRAGAERGLPCTQARLALHTQTDKQTDASMHVVGIGCEAGQNRQLSA